MKLASYVAGGKEAWGVVVGDAVVTMSDRLDGRYKTLRDALAAGALDEIRRAAKGAQADHKLSELRFLPAIPIRKNLRCRNQLPLACRRDRERAADARQPLHPLRRYPGRPRGRDDLAEGVGISTSKASLRS